MIQVDKIFIDKEGIKIPWTALEEMRDIYQQKIDNANDPRKIPYREGQKAVYDALLSYKDDTPDVDIEQTATEE